MLQNIEQLGDLLDAGGARRVLLVVDQQAYEKSGAAARLKPALAQFQTRLYSRFGPNPKISELQGAWADVQPATDEHVVAIGGGTAIDMAKLLCCFAALDVAPSAEALDDLETKRLAPAPRRHRLVAIPTTAGTGSEATHFAVAYAEGRKYSVAHESLTPDASLLDPTLTHSLPPSISAATGLDAAAQALESIWSVQATDASMQLAEQALRRAGRRLKQAVCDPTPEDRAAMLEAAHLAGQAINISRTTGPHAMSYRLTLAHGVPHGLAVALFLPPFIRYNGALEGAEVLDRRGPGHVEQAFGCIARALGIDAPFPDSAEAIAQRWEQLMQEVGCPRRLSDWGVTLPAEREDLASSVNVERLANNPRTASQPDLRALVEQIA